MASNSRVKREKIELISKILWGKRNKKGVQKKKLIYAPCESSIKTFVEEHVSSE